MRGWRGVRAHVDFRREAGPESCGALVTDTQLLVVIVQKFGVCPQNSRTQLQEGFVIYAKDALRELLHHSGEADTVLEIQTRRPPSCTASCSHSNVLYQIFSSRPMVFGEAARHPPAFGSLPLLESHNSK